MCHANATGIQEARAGVGVLVKPVPRRELAGRWAAFTHEKRRYSSIDRASEMRPGTAKLATERRSLECTANGLTRLGEVDSLTAHASNHIPHGPGLRQC